MAKINTRRKGNTAEREICKRLSKYFPGKFERRSMGIKGCDVICSDEQFPYAVEVKHQISVKAIHLFIGNQSTKKWWSQTVNQAMRVGKQPLLVAKVERYWFCTTDGVNWNLFDKYLEGKV